MLKKIISNGMIGFESGILGASFVKDISICGFIPKEFEGDRIDTRGQKLFNLSKVNGSIEDTLKMNMKLSDGCLIYDDGSELYLKYSSVIQEACISYEVPFLVLKHYDKELESKILMFLSNKKVKHLHICGIGNLKSEIDYHKKLFISFLNVLGYLR